MANFKNIDVESWDPALLFTPPEEDQEEKEEEIIDEGNNEIEGVAVAPGTTSPTSPNIDTSVNVGDSVVVASEPTDNADKAQANIQKSIVNISKIQNQKGNIVEPSEENQFMDFINLKKTDPNLNVSDYVDQEYTASLLEAENEKTQQEANAIALEHVESNLPNNEAVDFNDQEALDDFVVKTFDNIFENDKDLKSIIETIKQENQGILDEKLLSLQEELKKYKTFAFPKNYFKSISAALSRGPIPAVDYDEVGVTFTPDVDGVSAEDRIEQLNDEYSQFVNDLIINDPRFKERIEFLQNGLENAMKPLVTQANEKAAAEAIEKSRANLRLKRYKAELFGAEPDSIDNLGFGVNSVAIVQFLSGSDPDSWVRGIERFFGYNPYEVSDTIVTGLETVATDKFTQSFLMEEFARDMDYYNSYTHEGSADKWNNRKQKITHGKSNNTYNLNSRKHHLPDGDDSLVWYNEETGEWKPLIGNYSEYNRETGEYSGPLYSNPVFSLLNGNLKSYTTGYALKEAEKKGFKLLKFGEARKFIARDLNKKQTKILDRAVELMNKEAEKGLFTQEKFTDFLSNVASGNMAEAVRYLPKVVLKQVPYMAANFFSAGLYTMVSEGGNIGFDIAQQRAASSLGKDPSQVTGQELLDWIEANPEEFDTALTGGMMAGGAIAGLERAGIGYIIKSAKFGMSAFTQLIKGNVRKALSQSRQVAGNNLKAGFNEALTEGSQTGVEQLALGKFNAMEYVEAMGEGFLGGVLLPGLGSVTAATINQVVTVAKNTKLNIRDPKLYKKVNDLFKTSRIQLDNDLKDGTIDEKTYEKRLQKLSNDRNTLLKIPSYFSPEAKSEVFDIYQEMDALGKELEQVGGNIGLGLTITEEIKSLNDKLSEIMAQEGLNRQVGSLQALVDDANTVTMRTFENKAEADAFIDEQNQTGNWNKKASKDGAGVILQNDQTGEQLIIVDKESAKDVRDIAVADHEFLHALIFQTVKDNPKAQAALGKSLLNILDKMDKDGRMTQVLKERYKYYKGQPIEQQYEEALTFFADAIINEEITVNDSVIEKIGRVLRNLLQRLPFVNINFKTDRDVYNFVKDYALRRRAGKGLNAAQKRMLTRTATIGNKLGQGVSTQITDIIENQGGNLNKALSSKSGRTAQDLIIQYQQEGADMDIDLTQDLINQYYNLGLTAMGYSKEAGDIQVQDALNFLNSQFPSIAKNYTEINSETGRPQSLSNYITRTIGPRGKGFFKTEIERKKRTISKEKLEDKGRQIVDTDQQVDFDQRAKEDRGRAKVYPSSIKVIENNITGEIRTEQTANIKDDINRAIASGKTNPKQVAQTIVEKTKSKEYRAPIKKALGRWNSDQYNNNVDRLINRAFIKTLPIAQIKRRFGKLFNIKEIDRVPTVKVENGKRTDFKKPVYLIPEVTPQKIAEIKEYFKAGEKRHQSLMSLIAEGVAVEQMQEIKSDKNFMNDLQGRLEIKGSNLTADQFMDEVIFNLDKRNLEDKSFDVAKASNRKTKVQRVTGSPKIDLSSGSYETNIDKITTALDNVQGVPLVSGSRIEKGKDEKFGVMYEWTAIIPNAKGETDYEGAQTYGQARNEMVIDLIESFPPKDRPMVRQLILDMSTNQLFVSGKPGQIEGAKIGNLALYGAESEFNDAIPKYPNVKNKNGKDITTPIIKRKRYTDGDKKNYRQNMEHYN